MPKIIRQRATVNYINMRNKSRLLQELPSRLRGYRSLIDNGDDIGIVVLIDRDSDDCAQLKSRLELMARDAGLGTKTSTKDARFIVVNRIAIEELEAWFIGDHEPLKKPLRAFAENHFPNHSRIPTHAGPGSIFIDFSRSRAFTRAATQRLRQQRRLPCIWRLSGIHRKVSGSLYGELMHWLHSVKHSVPRSNRIAGYIG